ncbi:MAG: small multi-drug export protein [Spirochaetales bacterium]|jgi:uncharacterized membrane protein|nr:small multi-drug export protein [Exilispira sp.]NMC66861.1 small multi-drug export protein [Spirochaetales bacterium]
MNLTDLVKLIFLSILPISEVRGALPFAFFNKIPFYLAFPISVSANFLVSFFIFFFLDTINKLLLKIPLYNKIFTKFAANAKDKIYKKFSRYEYLGLTLFVGIPLPITGIWTGTLGAWILQLERKKVFVALFFGVLIAAIIVSLVLFFGLYSFKAFKIFLGKYF